jgi:hypothetical protein
MSERRALAFRELNKRFVTLPKGYLPGDTEKKFIPSFDSIPAVTRQDWEGFMLSQPKEFPKDGTRNWEWKSCMNCPVTHVNWEEGKDKNFARAEVQDFVDQVNAEARRQGVPCDYSVDSDDQLHYKYRGDVTGKSTAKYTVAKNEDDELIDVNEGNMNEYITHLGNSNTDGTGDQIQPLGTKKPNAFNIERPSVWIMSKESYSSDPDDGRSMRSGSWLSDIDGVNSAFRFHLTAGSHGVNVGFALARTCH